jgi:hypothetical protein
VGAHGGLTLSSVTQQLFVFGRKSWGPVKYKWELQMNR